MVPKKKGKQRSKSLAGEVIEFLTEIKEEERKEKQQKCDLAERMHKEKNVYYGLIPGHSVKEKSLKVKSVRPPNFEHFILVYVGMACWHVHLI